MLRTYHPQIGVGLRHPHQDYFLNTNAYLGQGQRPSWLEVHSENYFHQGQEQLVTLRQDYQLSCHGIGLSLGSATDVSRQHMQYLKALVDKVDPMFVSDHLSWSEHDGDYFNDLLPLPYTEEALAIFCRNVMQVQDYLGRELLIENPSSYLSFSHSSIPEWEFLSQVQQRTGCRLLLDLNNIYVSAFNHGFTCEEYLNGINPDSVDEIHLAGFSVQQLEQGEIWIDTHNQPVHKEVWQLFEHWTAQHGSRKTLIEWDQDIPEPAVLLHEAEIASHYLFASQTSDRNESVRKAS